MQYNDWYDDIDIDIWYKCSELLKSEEVPSPKFDSWVALSTLVRAWYLEESKKTEKFDAFMLTSTKQSLLATP